MNLSLRNLNKATTSLEVAANEPLNEFVRDSVIQRFEFTYELAWKAIRKQLIAELGEAAVEGFSRKDLFRGALQQKLIENFEEWVLFHEARNSTSHNYNVENAEKVYQVALQFLPPVKQLIQTLRVRGWIDATE